VHHQQQRPTPILPINYAWFLIVVLPEDIGRRPVTAQLTVVKLATSRRRLYPSIGPFGRIVAFEFRRTQSYSIYLNEHGDFARGKE
jgi:hypothetical protein